LFYKFSVKEVSHRDKGRIIEILKGEKKVSQSTTEYSQSSTEEKKLSERLCAIKKSFTEYHRVLTE